MSTDLLQPDQLPDILAFDDAPQDNLHEPRTLSECRTLVLNSDYTPVRYFPLSVWGWQKAVKLTYEGVVTPVAYYDEIRARSAHDEHLIPSVIALKSYVAPPTRVPFTRYNVYLRDNFTCAYCGEKLPADSLTFDHVHPRSRGGRTDWLNIATACHKCNTEKDNQSCKEAGMYPRIAPYVPSVHEIQQKGRNLPIRLLHKTWRDFVYWDSTLEP